MGIGTFTPRQQLDVAGTFNLAAPFVVTSLGNVGIGTVNPNNSLIVSSGNVGIDSAFPGQSLDVQGSIRVLGSASNIGINTSYPGEQLDINGTARMKQLIMSGGVPALNYVLTALDTSGDTTWSSEGIVSGWTVSTNSIYTAVATNNVGIGSSYPGQLLDVQGTVRILGGGNLGIGTSYPGTALDVNGTIRNLGSTIALGNVGIGTSLINGTGEAALTVMNGNVGIGTWTPFNLLDVQGSVAFGSYAGKN